MYNIKRVQPYLKEKFLNNLGQFLNTYDYYKDGVTELVENQIQQHTGREHAILVNSGSNALWMILSSIAFPDGEVIFPNYGYPSIWKVCHMLGLKPVPVDIKEDTLSMNPEEVSKAVNGHTCAIVHIGSNGVVGSDIKEIAHIAKYQAMCPFIEDAAPSLLQEFNGKRAGTFGDIAMYSFSATKPITCGEGAVIVTNNEKIYNDLKMFRYNGNYNNLSTSLNFSISPFLAAYLSPQLEENYLNEIIQQREKVHKMYKDGGLNVFEDEGITNRCGPVMYLSDQAKKISNKFNVYGIEHRYKYYPNFVNHLPVSKKVRNNIIDLPSHFRLNEKQVKFITGVIRSVENYE